MHANLKFIDPPTGLFEKIILAIKREQELRQTRKILFSFLSLLIVSVMALPLSAIMLAAQIENSGIIHFLSAAISDFGTSLALWQDFSLAILESLPIGSTIVFLLSLAVSVFTFRLFLHRKKLLFRYLLK